MCIYILLLEQSAPCMRLNIRDTIKEHGSFKKWWETPLRDPSHSEQGIWNGEKKTSPLLLGHVGFPHLLYTLQEINISHLGKIIIKYALSGGYVNSLEGSPQKKNSIPMADDHQICQPPRTSGIPGIKPRKKNPQPPTPSGVLAKQTVAPIPCGSTTSSSTPSIGWPSKGAGKN